MPVTLILGKLDTANNKLTYANAGHNPPIFYSAKNDDFKKLVRTGMLLGFDDTAAYGQETITFDPGDFIVLYTDGVPDATNENEETFDMERFENTITKNKEKSAGGIMDAIEKTVLDFIGTTSPYDDLTLLIIKCQ